MHRNGFKQIAYVTAIFFLASVAGLWAWNTLAELFGGPHAEYQHALAAAVTLLIARWSFSAGGLHWGYRRRENHERA